jgi:hypothetical protein
VKPLHRNVERKRAAALLKRPFGDSMGRDRLGPRRRASSSPRRPLAVINEAFYASVTRMVTKLPRGCERRPARFRTWLTTRPPSSNERSQISPSIMRPSVKIKAVSLMRPRLIVFANCSSSIERYTFLRKATRRTRLARSCGGARTRLRPCRLPAFGAHGHKATSGFTKHAIECRRKF